MGRKSVRACQKITLTVGGQILAGFDRSFFAENRSLLDINEDFPHKKSVKGGHKMAAKC